MTTLLTPPPARPDADTGGREAARPVEAKGWLSIPTKYDFHGWHGDSWYDKAVISHIPREVKLAVYLTDVRSGAFNYLKGTHGKQVPRGVKNDEVNDEMRQRLVEVTGK